MKMVKESLNRRRTVRRIEIYISTYGNAIKGGDLGERERLGEKGRKKKKREKDGMRVKKKILEKEKIFP